MTVQAELFEGVKTTLRPTKAAQAAFEIWNEMAAQHGWAIAEVWNKRRAQRLRDAVDELGGVHYWRALLEKCTTSDFLCGKVKPKDDRPRFDFSIDWATNPTNLTKIREGKYWRKNGTPLEVAPRAVDPLDEDRRKLRNYRPGGFWQPGWGDRPEHPGCRLDAELVAEWRKRHGVVVAERPQETREERLAATVELYRRHGRYGDANRVEEALAALQGRPPVLVPDPSARNPDVVPQTSAEKVTSHPKAPRYRWERPDPPPTEEHKTRAMAAAQDVPWEDVPEGEDFGDE